jgi:hypothetical protein
MCSEGPTPLKGQSNWWQHDVNIHYNQWEKEKWMFSSYTLLESRLNFGYEFHLPLRGMAFLLEQKTIFSDWPGGQRPARGIHPAELSINEETNSLIAKSTRLASFELAQENFAIFWIQKYYSHQIQSNRSTDTRVDHRAYETSKASEAYTRFREAPFNDRPATSLLQQESRDSVLRRVHSSKRW